MVKPISTPVLTEESSRSSVDSTLELLHDFGKSTTEHTNDTVKDIPSDLAPDSTEKPSTISSTSEILNVSEKHKLYHQKTNLVQTMRNNRMMRVIICLFL